MSPHACLRAGAAALALFASLGAGAAPAGADPIFREERVYLTCPGATPVQNVSRMLDAVQEDLTGAEGAGNAGWSTAEPAGAYTSQDPCGAQDIPVGEIENDGGQWHMVMRGSFTGNLDTIAFDLYQAAGLGSGAGYRVMAWLDGRNLHSGFDTVYPSVFPNNEDPYIYPGELATQRLRFAMADLGIVDDPEGPGTVEHDLLIRIDGPYSVIKHGPWLWGARSFPSGLEFNADVTGLPTPQDWDDRAR